MAYKITYCKGLNHYTTIDLVGKTYWVANGRYNSEYEICGNFIVDGQNLFTIYCDDFEDMEATLDNGEISAYLLEGLLYILVEKDIVIEDYVYVDIVEDAQFSESSAMFYMISNR